MNSKLLSTLALGAALIAQTASVSGAEAGFVEIFNGKDRHHWPDHSGEFDQGKHIPDLDQRDGSRLRTALLLQAHAGRQQGLRQLRHSVPEQSGKSR